MDKPFTTLNHGPTGCWNLFTVVCGVSLRKDIRIRPDVVVGTRPDDLTREVGAGPGHTGPVLREVVGPTVTVGGRLVVGPSIPCP